MATVRATNGIIGGGWDDRLMIRASHKRNQLPDPHVLVAVAKQVPGRSRNIEVGFVYAVWILVHSYRPNEHTNVWALRSTHAIGMRFNILVIIARI